MVPVSRNTKLESNLLADLRCLGYQEQQRQQPLSALFPRNGGTGGAGDERCLVVGDCGKTKVFSDTEEGE